MYSPDLLQSIEISNTYTQKRPTSSKVVGTLPDPNKMNPVSRVELVERKNGKRGEQEYCSTSCSCLGLYHNCISGTSSGICNRPSVLA